MLWQRVLSNPLELHGRLATGVAGPNPLDGHPVGAVWVAIEGPISQTIELSLSGERESVRNAATSSAIATFARILRHRV